MAVLLTAAALGVRDLIGLGQSDGESGQLVFVVPIVISAYLGGFGPGIVATLVSAAVIALFILAPFGSTAESSLQSAEYVTLLVVGVCVSVVSEALHRARRLQVALRRQHAVTLASIGDAVISTDGDGRVTFLNAVAERLTGWVSEDAIGQSLELVFCIVDATTHETVSSALERVLRDGGTVACSQHSVLIAKHGRELPVSGSATPIRETNGCIRGIVVVFRDATEERAKGRALQEQLALQEELARVVATAPGILYSFELCPDGSTRFPYASPRLREIFGVEPEELTRSADGVFALVKPEDREGFQHSIAESARTLSEWRIELRVNRPDGTPCWVEGHSTPRLAPNGSVIWHGYINDITERKLVEEALQAARETLRLLIEQAPVSIAMLDRDMTYLSYSHQWLADYGRGHASLLGRCHYDVNPDLPGRWREIHRQCMAGSACSNDEDSWIQEDGSRNWLRWAVHPWRDGTGAVGGIIIFAENITHRIRGAEALQESERRYRDLVQMSPDPILVFHNGLVAFTNDAALQLFGASAPQDLLGRQVSSLVPEGDLELVYAEAENLKPGAPTAGIRHRICRLDGEILEVEGGAALIDNAGSEGADIQVVMRDITERRRQEQVIEEREARLSGIINSAMDGIITIDSALHIVLVNPAAERIFGRCAESMLGQPLSMLLPERFRTGHVDQVMEFAGPEISNRRMHSDEAMLGLRANGEEFPLEASISTVRVAGETLATVILRDVTDRQRAEQALKASDERFRQLAESIREVFWLTDSTASVLEYVSPAYESIWGRSLASLSKSPLEWSEAIHEQDRARVLKALHANALRGTYDEEYRIVRPDGSLRWIRDRSFPVRNGDGTVRRVAGVAEDITERRHLEEQLRQSQKLESIGLLAGGVAHDFNNWLTVIGANSELLLSTMNTDHDGADLVQEIRHAGDRAASLTRQLLAFSRQQVLEPKIVDLNTVVADTEKLLRRLIGEDVELTTELRPVSKVLVDPGHMVQVLMNLAVNARDAMPTGGRLTLETRDITVDEHVAQTHANVKAGRYVLLRMTDTGIGMSPEVRERVFEPFFTTKRVGKGTGLGLSVVHGIVVQSGGFLNLESKEGVGTSFQIMLPAVERSAGAVDGSARPDALRGSETVLVVEDEDSVRRVAVRALRGAGYTVLEASDGRDAMRVLAGHVGDIDLLLTDVVMPTMGGRELAMAVKELRPRTAVLFTSGYTDDAVVRHGVLHADVAFLQKPYNVNSLRAKVRQVLEGKGLTRRS